jgi:type IV pilus assembly protein PilY1
MFSIDTRFRSLAVATLLTLCATQAAADDVEIYQSQSGAKPNVLFIMDTSGSMDTEVKLTPAPYDPNKTYTSTGCSTDRIYFSTGNTPPDCGTDNWIPRSAFACNAAAAALVNIGGTGQWPGLGNPSAIAAQFRESRRDDDGYKWRSLSNNSDWVECKADDGVHGQTSASSKKWIGNGNEGPWDSGNNSLWSSIDNAYRFYTANFLHYKAGPGDSTMTRLQIVRDVAINLASSLNGVNLGLMRYSENAEGGYVLEPVADIDTNRTSIINTLKGFDPDEGNGGTPLSETFYEAALYLQGRTWDFGSKSNPGHSVSGSRVNDSQYKTPLEFKCQKNYVVYLTDGAPTRDSDANVSIEKMIGKSCANQVEPFHDSGWVEGSGICMDELAAWMADDQNTDLAPGDRLPGLQNANTYMIGFGDSLGDATVKFLTAIAKAGRTEQAYTAGDVPTLTAALQTIFSDLQEDSATFVTPSIAVNAFNRAQTDNDLFYSLFKVGKRQHWPGNLKKYKLVDDKIVDGKGNPAVASTGFFAKGTTSIWSTVADGDDVTIGGAVDLLDPPDSRKIYTSVSSKDLSGDAKNAVTTTAMTDALVGTGSATTGCSAACTAAVNWARGKDPKDPTKQVKFMGDPIHGRPAVVTYGKTSTAPDAESDTVVYMPTNDGFLHAISGITASGGGKELWAYIPPVLLPRLGTLSQDVKAPHTYGLDGDIRVLKFDKNQNGLVESGDFVWLFFGMRGGGNRYFGLDVTDREKPKLLWDIGSAQLPGIGQSWSAPVITRVNVSGGNTDSEKLVLIFGGGYDTKQETQSYSTDTVGNRIFMVEAKTGTLLWSAGGPGSTPVPDLLFNTSGKEMNNSIPGNITVIDTNGDQFADRMYAGDMGGRIWRFDIFNGQPRATLVTGGIIAKLGAGGISPAAASENRRFYNAPDVSLIQFRGIDPFYNIAIGSGYRGHPLDVKTTERFYAIRDKQPYAQLTQDDYNRYTPILDSDAALIDVTSDPVSTKVTSDDKGWKLTMNRNGTGEKVLSEATQVNNVVLFTSFQPSTVVVNPCFPTTINRAYAMTAFGGKPAIDLNNDGKIDGNDISTTLAQQGIVGDVVVALQRKGASDPGDPLRPKTVCLVGTELLKKCVDVGGTVRTFWNRGDAQ